jgi:hypothetical protein
VGAPKILVIGGVRYRAEDAERLGLSDEPDSEVKVTKPRGRQVKKTE